MYTGLIRRHERDRYRPIYAPKLGNSYFTVGDINTNVRELLRETTVQRGCDNRRQFRLHILLFTCFTLTGSLMKVRPRATRNLLKYTDRMHTMWKSIDKHSLYRGPYIYQTLSAILQD